jgi:hypothetical protein
MEQHQVRLRGAHRSGFAEERRECIYSDDWAYFKDGVYRSMMSGLVLRSKSIRNTGQMSYKWEIGRLCFFCK